jgi:hypothetical protein
MIKYQHHAATPERLTTEMGPEPGWVTYETSLPTLGPTVLAFESSLQIFATTIRRAYLKKVLL